MKKRTNIVLAILSGLLFLDFGQAQTIVMQPGQKGPIEMSLERALERPKPPRMSGSLVRVGSSQEIVRRLRKQSEADGELRARYRDFLRQSGTGIFKFVVPRDCDSLNTMREITDCGSEKAEIEFQFAEYSFRDKKLSYLNPDILYRNGTISPASVLVQAAFVKLEDGAVQEVTLGSEGLDYLISLNIESVAAKADEQLFRHTFGVEEGDFRYVRSIRPEKGDVYAARLVSYDLDGRDAMSPKPADLIVAFEIIEQEPDGTLTILWKELRRQKAPRLTL